MFHIQENINLLPYNTFHFPCIARFFVVITTPNDFMELIDSDIFTHTPKKLFLGGGSNMLFASDYFDGLVIKNEITGITCEKIDDERVVLNVGSGEGRNDFVHRTVEQGRVGIENLISIPGTVGAAPVQNIGAYGSEAQDTILSVAGIDCITKQHITYTKEECCFGYRTSVFKTILHNRFFITSVQFGLAKYIQDQYNGNVNYEGVEETMKKLINTYPKRSRLQCIAQAIAKIRESKLPDFSKIGTAGSFFQNPVIHKQQFETLLGTFPQLKGWPLPNDTIKLSAGQLIELAGFKGHTENNVGVYEHHALVLVHHGNSTGSYLLDVIQKIQDTVETLFTIQLIPEVQIIH